MFFFAESFNLSPDDIDNPVRVKSISESMWWACVTIATVGYGDYVPVTLIGKIIASFVAVLGMLLLSLPVAILGVNFQQTFSTHAEKEKIELFRESRYQEQSKMDDSQRQIYFMDERIKTIDEANKTMIKMLADSETIYKSVARDLRHMYRSIYADEQKAAKEEEEHQHQHEHAKQEHHENPNHEEHHSPNVASKLEMRIKLYEKINRAKKKISAANIFQRLKKGPGGTQTSRIDGVVGTTDKSMDVSDSHRESRDDIIPELPELKQRGSSKKASQKAMNLPLLGRNNSKLLNPREDTSEYIETEYQARDLIEIPALERTVNISHVNTYKKLYHEYRKKEDQIEGHINTHHLNRSLSGDDADDGKKFGIKCHSDHGENDFLRYYIEHLQFISQTLLDELIDTEHNEGSTFSDSCSNSGSEDDEKEKRHSQNKPGHVVPNKLNQLDAANMRRRGSLDSNTKIIIPNIHANQKKEKEKHHHNDHHHHENGHHHNHQHEHGHSNHQHQHHHNKHNHSKHTEHGERIPKNFDPKTWKLTGKILENIEAKQQYDQIEKLQNEIASDKQKGRKKRKAFTQVKSDSQKMKEFLKAEHQIKVDEWIKNYKEDKNVHQKLSKELHLHKNKRLKHRLNHPHHLSENKDAFSPQNNEHSELFELLPEIKEADEDEGETAFSQSDKFSLKSKFVLNSVVANDRKTYDS